MGRKRILIFDLEEKVMLMTTKEILEVQGFLLKIGNTDKETAAKLKKALITVVDSFREKLNGNG